MRRYLFGILLFLMFGSLAFSQLVGTQVVVGNVGSGATDAGNPVKVGGRYNSSAPTLTDGQRGDFQLDSAGRLIVNVGAGSSGNAAASATGSAVPASAGYGGVNVGGTLRGATAVNPSGSVYAQQMDLASAAGTTLDVNSGNKSAGTIRFVLATDQPALTNKLLVTPDLPSGASTAAKQPALGTAGSASSDVITIQGVASMTKLLVTPDSVALPANQSVNISQINGVTPLMGAGNTGTGSPRVTIASDQAAIPVSQSGNFTFIPKTGCGTTAADSAFIANIATGGTDFFTAATCVGPVTISNTTTSNSTFTLQDKTGTPNVLYSAVPLPANSAITINLGFMKFVGGLTVKCGNATTCQGQAFGWQ